MEKFEMVAKTFMGLEEVLAEELIGLGAENVEPGKRMVSFEGDLEMLYRANLCCRTALRILKPFYKFTAVDADDLYDRVKEFDWGSLLSVDKTFAIDVTVYSEEFTHSRYVTYRVKDAIVDWFKDRYGENARPGVRLEDADVKINVHISGYRCTLSLDSSGESLHKRGYRVAQTEAPINEVLAAGILLRSGWRGDVPLVDPMCGSGTFLIEAALIAANIMPGVYRRHFAFESWPDFDRELFDRIYNDDSAEREIRVPIIGADISPKAIAIATENVKSAGVAKYITLETKSLNSWSEAPEGGVLVTNPPYGERLKVEDLEGLYALLGTKLKFVFKGYHAWIIGYNDDNFRHIGLAPSQKIPMMNGSLECELREYIIFDGDYRSFRKEGGSIKDHTRRDRDRKPDKKSFRKPEKPGKPGKPGKFGKKSDWSDKSDRSDRFGKRSDKSDRFGKKSDNGFDKPQHRRLTPEEVSEKRRKWLDKISSDPRRPSLPSEGSSKPEMRRRGWKKND